MATEKRPPIGELIQGVLSEEPQTSEEIRQALFEALGPVMCPSAHSVQSALSTRGEKWGTKIRGAHNRIKWIAGVVSSGKKKSPKLAKKEAAAATKAISKASIQAKADEMVAQPFSAFALFGFAQRGVLKKQKPGATVKDVVKAIGAAHSALPL